MERWSKEEVSLSLGHSPLHGNIHIETIRNYMYMLNTKLEFAC